MGPELRRRRRGWAFALIAFCLAFTLVALVLLERVGLPRAIVQLAVPAAVAAMWLALGFGSRTMRISEFYLSGRRVTALPNGMAIAADWLSGTLLLALAGAVYAFGDGAGLLIAGWTGGFVLLAVLLAPYLNRSGALTVPDFLAARYPGRLVRLMALAVLVAVSLPLLAAQLAAIGFIAPHFLAIPAEAAILAALAVMTLCSLAGGMRALTWTQGALFLVLAVAFLTPLALLSMEAYGVPVPQLALGEALTDLREMLAAMPREHFPVPGEPSLLPTGGSGPWQTATALAGLMIATASLPHLLARFLTAPSSREARRGAGWGLIFTALLLSAVPVYAVFARLGIIGAVVGVDLDALPDWVTRLGSQGLVRICGAGAASAEAIRTACTGLDSYYSQLALADFDLAPQAVVPALPEISGQMATTAALLSTGLLAAAAATANGLLLAIANSLAHDGYHRTAGPAATAARRLFVARLMLLLVAAFAGYAALGGAPMLARLVPAALALAAAGLFPALVLGIWWKRTTTAGAAAGMAAGIAVALFLLAGNGMASNEMASTGWLAGLGVAMTDGLAGVATGFVVAIAASLFTAPPGESVGAFVEEIRRPGARMAIQDRAV